MFGKCGKEIYVIDNSTAFAGNCYSLDSQVALSMAEEAACTEHGRNLLTGESPKALQLVLLFKYCWKLCTPFCSFLLFMVQLYKIESVK